MDPLLVNIVVPNEGDRECIKGHLALIEGVPGWTAPKDITDPDSETVFVPHDWRPTRIEEIEPHLPPTATTFIDDSEDVRRMIDVHTAPNARNAHTSTAGRGMSTRDRWKLEYETHIRSMNQTDSPLKLQKIMDERFDEHVNGGDPSFVKKYVTYTLYISSAGSGDRHIACGIIRNVVNDIAMDPITAERDNRNNAFYAVLDTALGMLMENGDTRDEKFVIVSDNRVAIQHFAKASTVNVRTPNPRSRINTNIRDAVCKNEMFCGAIHIALNNSDGIHGTLQEARKICVNRV